MCNVSDKGVPQYDGTECMFKFMTLAKALQAKQGPGGVDDLHVRVGMNQDDCENSAFQSKAIMDHLACAARMVNGSLFHTVDGISTNSTVELEKHRTDDEETLRQMYVGAFDKQDQRRFLLCMETCAQIKTELAYFVAGSPSQSNDKVHPSTKADFHSVSMSTSNTESRMGLHENMIELPEQVGSGINLYGESGPTRKLNGNNPPQSNRSGPNHTHLATNDTSGSTNDTASATGGLNGHCTCILSYIRPDGLNHSTVVEGTAHLIMGTGDEPVEVKHRGTVDAPTEQQSEEAGHNGKFGGPIEIDDCVDVTVKGTLSSHISIISNRLVLPGTTMRPCIFMGTGWKLKNNVDKFYKDAVCVGTNQYLKVNAKKQLEPGADVKTLINQKIMPMIKKETIEKGEEAIVQEMGNAKCAMFSATDPSLPEYIQYQTDARDFGRAMSPLRMSPEKQKEHMLSKLGPLSTLKVNFPDSDHLDRKHGKNIRTFFVTHVAKDDSPTGMAEVKKAIVELTEHLNKDYVNVRVAMPVEMPSGEFLTHYRIYGVPLDPLLP